MGARRIYRTFDDPSFPLITKRSKNRPTAANFTTIHWHHHFEICYVAAGSFELYQPSGNIMLYAGDMCIFSPSDHHCIRSASNGSEYWSIYFMPELLKMPEGHFFQEEFAGPLMDGSLRLPGLLRSEQMATEIFEDMQKLITSGEKGIQFSAMIDLCVQLLPMCIRLDSQDLSLIAATHPAIREITLYMEANYAERISLKTLAKRVHLHPNYLCALWKRHTGQTIYQYQTRLRLFKAKDMLRQQQTVSQVSEALGFPSVDFFRRKFRKLNGVSPSQFRKSCDE